MRYVRFCNCNTVHEKKYWLIYISRGTVFKYSTILAPGKWNKCRTVEHDVDRIEKQCIVISSIHWIESWFSISICFWYTIRQVFGKICAWETNYRLSTFLTWMKNDSVHNVSRYLDIHCFNWNWRVLCIRLAAWVLAFELNQIWWCIHSLLEMMDCITISSFRWSLFEALRAVTLSLLPTAPQRTTQLNDWKVETALLQWPFQVCEAFEVSSSFTLSRSEIGLHEQCKHELCPYQDHLSFKRHNTRVKECCILLKDTGNTMFIIIIIIQRRCWEL